jgi:arylsulfatase A-like enzyme/Flp pilus assembly protein TadD
MCSGSGKIERVFMIFFLLPALAASSGKGMAEERTIGSLSGPAGSLSKVILITVDTLRADRLSCYGYSHLQTVHIDRLASDGIRFENAVAQVPLTLPSHCSIMTGTYPIYHGVHDQTDYLPENITTLAGLLKAHGFTTAAFVSAFVLNSQFGLNRGFDVYDDTFEAVEGVPRSELERRGDRTLSRALQWMGKLKTGKFFVWIHFYDPHAPYAPPQPYRTRYAGRPYDGEVAFVDALIGKLTDFLKRQGWYSQALVVFTSDHGEDLGDHGENTHGFFVYDSTLRVPLIIKLPSGHSAGRMIPEQVQSVDIAPTILQALSLPPGPEMQGRSLLSAMLQRSRFQSPALGESWYPFVHFGWSPLRFLRTERFKYIDAPKPELYDLREDPKETHNLIDSQKTTALELQRQLNDLWNRFHRVVPRAARERRVDQATLANLKSLGYVSYAANRSASAPIDTRQLPDPKDELRTYNRLQSALLDKQNNRLPQAIQKLQLLIDSEPKLIDGQLELGLCYKRLGEYGRAIEQFKKVLEYNPSSTIATYNLANTYAQTGKIEEAVVGFKRTLELNPHESSAHVGLGIAYQMRGELNQAVAEYQQALELDPSNAAALSNLGAALLSQGNTDRAITCLQRALKINPQSAETHNTLGAALMMGGKLQEAVVEFRRAISENSNYAGAYVNLGIALTKQGNLQEGIASLRKAVAINPASGQAHYLLGQAYTARGMNQAAEAEYQAAKQLGYR